MPAGQTVARYLFRLLLVLGLYYLDQTFFI